MTPEQEQWERVGRIVNAAAALQPEERPSFLDQACGADETLRRDVESLLSLDGSDNGGFLSSPAIEEAAKLLTKAAPRFSAGTRLGNYVVLEFVASAGMGEIYKARNATLGNSVALKFLPPALAQDTNRLRRLKQEARAASSLNHPNIITVHDFVEAERSHFIVSEYVEGETLRERMMHGRIDLQEAINIATQIATGLGAAHAVGVIHRDIKPENIMLRPDGYVKILDFGLAKLNEQSVTNLSQSSLLKTEPEMPIGTPRYMSPEQIRGLPLDARTDVWSLGVVLYEMLSGRKPFEGITNSDVLASILAREPRPLASSTADVPPKLQRIVLKALQKDRDERYQGVKDLLLDLKRPHNPLTTPTPTTPTDDNISKKLEANGLVGKTNRHKTVAALLLTALLVAAAGVVYLAYTSYQGAKANQQATNRTLSRLTFDPGLQTEPTWSPDGRYIAYSSDKSGNFDIWVQPVGGGDAVKVTRSPAHDWQPDWSINGSHIVFRSERDGGGLYIVPVLGGHEQKISSFGYRPHWSPDGSQILFTDMWQGVGLLNSKVKLYVVRPGGGEPREVLADFMRGSGGVYSFAWHPDGQRITILRGDGFWTVPFQGGPPVKSEIIGDVCAAGEFRWAPAGDALYFQGLSQEVKNLWKVDVDPQSLRFRGHAERITTGAGSDTDISLSPDGARLAFTTRVEDVRIWSLPYDARAGKLAAEGQPVTAPGIIPTSPDLTQDGQKLVFIALRTGTQKKELWEKSLADGRERLLTVKEYPFFSPRWSRDGTRLAYQLPTWIVTDPKVDPATVILPVGGGDEQKLTSGKGGDALPFDWSADGRWVLAGSDLGKPGQSALVMLPVAASPHAEAEARVVVSDSERMLFEGRFSPDDRWVCFNAVGRGSSTLYVVAASGGKWVRITEENGWADKPRWSPDGRAIYFVSRRGTGFLNVWKLKFDPLKGEPLGEPFQVTSYQSPAKGIWTDTGPMAMSVSADRLVLSIREVTGSIWMLDGFDR